MESYESVLLVKPEVYVFNLPPRPSNRGYRAADWNLTTPSWTGRLRLVSKEGKCAIKLEDKNTGELFAKCPIETYPGIAIEAVTDSSRYFVIKIEDDNGRTAFIGLGFGDRSDSFDMNVALQDHFKWAKKEKELETSESKPELDLAFKEGETIKINMKITKKDGSEATSKPKPKSNNGILAPPPGSNKIAPPPKLTPLSSPAHQNQPSEWGQLSSSSSQNEAEKSPAVSPAVQNNWVQF